VFTQRAGQTLHQPLRFPGQEAEQINGEPNGISDRSYNIARWYRAGWGRFLSVDPVIDIERAKRNPQAWNRYAYVQNNPINRVDPDGRLDDAVHTSMMFDCQLNNCRPNWEEDKKVVAAGLFAASLFLPGPEDAVLAVAGATRLGRAALDLGGRLFARFGRAADDTLQKIFEVQRGKGDFGIGSMSASKADKIGRSWVGDGATPLMENGKQIGLVSSDRSRVYRFPSEKVKSGRYQANIEEITTSRTGQRTRVRNAHIDIIE
jgi:RHS repeat-associated protein